MFILKDKNRVLIEVQRVEGNKNTNRTKSVVVYECTPKQVTQLILKGIDTIKVANSKNKVRVQISKWEYPKKTHYKAFTVYNKTVAKVFKEIYQIIEKQCNGK